MNCYNALDRTVICGLAICVATCIAATADAAVNITAADRSVITVVDPAPNPSVVSTATSGLFSEAVNDGISGLSVGAVQDTTITATGLFGSGSVDISGDGTTTGSGIFGALSVVSIEFMLTETYNLDYTVAAALESDNPNLIYSGFPATPTIAAFRVAEILSGGGLDVITFPVDQDPTSAGGFNETDTLILDSGNYLLEVGTAFVGSDGAASPFTGLATYSFDVEFSPIPEPSSLSLGLLAGGAGAVVAFRRRRSA